MLTDQGLGINFLEHLTTDLRIDSSVLSCSVGDHRRTFDGQIRSRDLTATLIAALSSNAFAQSPLQRALDTLASEGRTFPAGWTVQAGKNQSGAPAEIGLENKTVTVDADGIVGAWPSMTKDNITPGVLYIILLHEWFHVCEESGGGCGAAGGGGGGSPPYNTKPRVCGEIQLTAGIAVWHCELIHSIFNSGGNPEALCKMFNDVRKNFNKNAKKRHKKSKCPGNYPGDIAPCAGCG